MRQVTAVPRGAADRLRPLPAGPGSRRGGGARVAGTARVARKCTIIAMWPGFDPIRKSNKG
ncbi:hypothetical protein, partial [Streptomyces clavifer]